MADNTTTNEPPPIRQLSAPELMAWIESGAPFELVDVRTDEERAFARPDASRLLDQAYHDALLQLDRDTRIVFLCHHGVRSQQAAQYFRREGFRNLHNQSGTWDPFHCSSISQRRRPSCERPTEMSTIPIIRNGPPGTFVLFPNGLRGRDFSRWPAHLGRGGRASDTRRPALLRERAFRRSERTI